MQEKRNTVKPRFMDGRLIWIPYYCRWGLALTFLLNSTRLIRTLLICTLFMATLVFTLTGFDCITIFFF